MQLSCDFLQLRTENTFTSSSNLLSYWLHFLRRTTPHGLVKTLASLSDFVSLPSFDSNLCDKMSYRILIYHCEQWATYNGTSCSIQGSHCPSPWGRCCKGIRSDWILLNIFLILKCLVIRELLIINGLASWQSDAIIKPQMPLRRDVKINLSSLLITYEHT